MKKILIILVSVFIISFNVYGDEYNFDIEEFDIDVVVEPDIYRKDVFIYKENECQFDENDGPYNRDILTSLIIWTDEYYKNDKLCKGLIFYPYYTDTENKKSVIAYNNNLNRYERKVCYCINKDNKDNKDNNNDSGCFINSIY